MADLDAYNVRLAGRYKNYVMDGRNEPDPNSQGIRPLAAVPLIYQKRFMGALLVRSDDPTRVWQENEILLLRTVADQVTVAVNHARLFLQMQQQALTDGLTNCFNRRALMETYGARCVASPSTETQSGRAILGPRRRLGA